MNRAYSILNVKSIKDEDGERIITGLATTPTADRMGDTVQPMGAKFKLPMPLLWQHDHEKPVGHVEFAQPTKDGIPFTARIAKILEPGILKDRVDEAWQSVKAGLVSAVSIGFNPLKYKATKTGIDFEEWEWFELSLVTIPANAEANIFTVKSLDHKILEAKSCADKKAVVQYKHKPAGASANNPTQQKTGHKMNINEQLAALRAKQETHAKRMQEIMEKSVESGETLDASAQEEFDNLETEIGSMEAQEKRLMVMEKMSSKTRTEVKGNSTTAATQSRTPSTVQLKEHGGDVKGLAFAQFTKALALSRGNVHTASQMLEQNPNAMPVAKGFAKAAVQVGTTSSPNWASTLVGDERADITAFLDFLRPQTIIGQLNPTRVPFYSPWIEQTAGGSAQWVGEAKAKPVTSFQFRRDVLHPNKLAAITVLSMETVRDSSPSADMLVRNSLANAIIARQDEDFINPAKAAVAGVSPASITNGQTSVASTGNTSDDVKNDIRAAVNFIIARARSMQGVAMIMNSAQATALQFMYNPLGQREFGNIGANGGDILGIRVIVSDYVPLGTIVFLRENDVVMADDGGIAVDWTDQASVKMSDDPEVDAVELTSLWQNNLVGFRAERTISWTLARAQPSVYVLTGVTWGAATP